MFPFVFFLPPHPAPQGTHSALPCWCTMRIIREPRERIARTRNPIQVTPSLFSSGTSPSNKDSHCTFFLPCNISTLTSRSVALDFSARFCPFLKDRVRARGWCRSHQRDRYSGCVIVGLHHADDRPVEGICRAVGLGKRVRGICAYTFAFYLSCEKDGSEDLKNTILSNLFSSSTHRAPHRCTLAR